MNISSVVDFPRHLFWLKTTLISFVYVSVISMLAYSEINLRCE